MCASKMSAIRLQYTYIVIHRPTHAHADTRYKRTEIYLFVSDLWLIVFPFTWEFHGTHGIPVFSIPISMHISTASLERVITSPALAGVNAAIEMF